MLLKIGIIFVFGLLAHIKAFDECENQPWIFPNIKSRCPEGKGHCRVRKEFTHMTLQERCRFVEAVIRVSTEDPFKTAYKNLLCIHRKHFSAIHGGFPEIFLPFHRWLILQYESLLRRVDCAVTVSYWDWSANATNPFQSDVWGANCALGGNGNEKNDHMVQTGPFRGSVWPMIPDTDNFYLQRHFDKNATLTYLTPAYVMITLLKPTFLGFTSYLENSYHNKVHHIIGGTMIADHAGWAPEFFFHHGFLDKLWDDWQSWCGKHTADMMRFFKFYDTKLGGTVGVTSSSVLDLLNQPGNICVKYKTYDDLPLSKLEGFLQISGSGDAGTGAKYFRRLTEPAADHKCTGLSDKTSADVILSKLSKGGANCEKLRKKKDNFSYVIRDDWGVTSN